MIGKFAYLVHFLGNLHWILIWLDILDCFGADLAALDSQLLLKINCLACCKFNLIVFESGNLLAGIFVNCFSGLYYEI